MIQSGTYKARGVEGSVQWGTTKNGTDQMVVDLDLVDIGERVSCFLYFTEKSAPHSVKRLRALGWTGDDLSDVRGIDAADVDVSVSYEEYNGKQQMKVEIVTGSTVTVQDPMSAGAKKSFAQRYANLVKSTPAAQAAKGNGVPF